MNFTRTMIFCATALSLRAGEHSALNPGGVQASRIGDLWWLYVAVCAAVYVLVLLFLAAPLQKRRSNQESMTNDAPILAQDPKRHRRLTWAVTSSVAATAAIVFWLALSDFFTQRALGALAQNRNALKLRVTGQQWWWRVEYETSVASNMVSDANGFHIPVGRPVEIDLLSSDVIHSFWVPNLHGKRDLVTGHKSRTWLRADRPGTYEGQCAEFCGLEHAKMRLIVVAEESNKFDAWYKSQQQNAKAPSTEEERRGYAVFMSSTCVMCHNISGTPASGQLGPDLSHVGSRPRIAGAYLENNRGNLTNWINHAQHLKPGARMPQHHLTTEELSAVATYLQSLK